MLTCALSSFVCAAKVVCPQNSTKNIPRFRKVFTVSSILKLCDFKCSLLCEGTIKSSSPEPTIANYIRDTSSIPIYLMTEKKLRWGWVVLFHLLLVRFRVVSLARIKITLADRYYRWNAALKLAWFFFGWIDIHTSIEMCQSWEQGWRFS